MFVRFVTNLGHLSYLEADEVVRLGWFDHGETMAAMGRLVSSDGDDENWAGVRVGDDGGISPVLAADPFGRLVEHYGLAGVEFYGTSVGDAASDPLLILVLTNRTASGEPERRAVALVNPTAVSVLSEVADSLIDA